MQSDNRKKDGDINELNLKIEKLQNDLDLQRKKMLNTGNTKTEVFKIYNK